MNTKTDETDDKWYDDFNWGGAIMIGVVAVGIILVLNLNFLFPNEMEEIRKSNEEIRIKNQIIADEMLEYRIIAKDSINCKELQEARLGLLGNGANAESWTPRANDKALKIANERSDIICSEKST